VGIHEEGFEVGVELAVHHGHGELVLVVGDGANAAQDGLGVLGVTEVDEQAVEGGDGDVLEAGGGDGFGDHLHALFDGEERGAFVGVAQDATTSSSTIREPRSMRSRWPLVRGSNVRDRLP